jgi:RecA/RadA recombinase
MSILAESFREQVSKMKDPRMKTETEFDVYYSTGFLPFDFMNGCKIHVNTNGVNTEYYSVGIQDGSINMVIGRSGCGKTTWVEQAAANIIRPFKTSCIFEEVLQELEKKYYQDLLEKIWTNDMFPEILVLIQRMYMKESSLYMILSWQIDLLICMIQVCMTLVERRYISLNQR